MDFETVAAIAAVADSTNASGANSLQARSITTDLLEFLREHDVLWTEQHGLMVLATSEDLTEPIWELYIRLGEVRLNDNKEAEFIDG